jgi:nitroreductase
MSTTTNPVRTGGAELAVHPLLAQRWSPRGFDTEHVLSDEDLYTLLEAARWAPSSGNSQPWRFLLGRRGDAAHERLVKHLAPGNQLWAPTASLLFLAAAATVDEEGRHLGHAWYDTGQAVADLTVQATALGLAVHQMGGFDAAGMAAEFGLPETIEPVTMVAVGRFDPDAELPEFLWNRERAPRERRPVSEILLQS